MKKEISLLLKNLCCSKCKSDFDENSIKFIYREKDYNVIHLFCSKCGKDFGMAYLNMNDKISEDEKDIILNDIRNTPPITTDEVIDAHNQIKDFEKNWKRFIDD